MKYEGDESQIVSSIKNRKFRCSYRFRRAFAEYINRAREARGLEDLDTFVQEVNRCKVDGDGESPRVIRRLFSLTHAAMA